MAIINLQEWLGLVIGNSRLHWAFLKGTNLIQVWDTEHIANPVVEEQLPTDVLPDVLIKHLASKLPLYIASVVPLQTALWHSYSPQKILSLEQIPLKRIYPTMGIDRALALLGAGETYGFPCLVIDVGTALTLTGVNDDRALVGGAILPGLTMQLQSLASKTAALPEIQLPQNLPRRWALSTPEAIQSGVIYTILEGVITFIQDWLQQFPVSKIIVTGGDAKLLVNYWKIYAPHLAETVIIDNYLIFEGMKLVVC